MMNNSKVLSSARSIAGYVGFNVFLVGMMMLATLAVLFFYPSEIDNAK